MLAKNKILLACLVLLFILYFNWIISRQNLSIIAFICSAVVVTLFGVLGVKFIKQSIHAVLCEDVGISNAKPSACVGWVFVGLLGVGVIIVLLGFVLQILGGNTDNFTDSLNVWSRSDGNHYLDIASDWYLSHGEWSRLVQLVFLPGYPVVVHVINLLIGNYLYAAMITSLLCFAGAGTLMYSLVCRKFSEESAKRALKYLCLLPGAIFFVAPMSESMFLLLSVACIYFVRKKSFLLACLFGALATFTRSVGLVLLAPVCVEIILNIIKTPTRGIKRYLQLLYALIIPVGFAVYCYINYTVSGDALKFMEYQSEHWSQFLGWFFNTSAYQADYLIGTINAGDFSSSMGLWIPGLLTVILSPVPMILCVRKMPLSYTAYFIGYYLITMGATWLLSAPRYMGVMFPLAIALALITKNKLADNVLTIALSIIFTIYLFMFVNGWQVW